MPRRFNRTANQYINWFELILADAETTPELLAELEAERGRIRVALAHARAYDKAASEEGPALLPAQMDALVSLGRFQAELAARDVGLSST